ncbi:MAG: response regulator [Ectothiorhodospiraceae bacterium]|nr:response regulator [Chromatiales bacterium]MCP5153772.1 response regulator [Ectothiorhodospiraceae bacterium]
MHTHLCRAAVDRPRAVRPTVFVVDDDAAVRAALDMLLRVCGWQTRCCGSAQEFLQVFDASQTGCLVLDLQMPGMTGVELQEMLSDLDIQLPVIIITAYTDHALTERARAAGAVAVLRKPFHDEELVSTVQSVLGNVPTG